MSNSTGARTENRDPEKVRIIKAVDVPLLKNAADIVEKAKVRAASILEQAQADAGKITENARLEAASVIENARAQAQDLADSIEREERIRVSGEIVENTLRAYSDLQKQLNSVDEQLVQLVGRALKKIAGEMDESDRIERIVTQGLLELKEKYGLTLLVHISQFDAAQNAVSRMQSSIARELQPIHRVEVDANLQPGECCLLSSGGLLDVSVTTQIESIVEGLRNIHHEV